MRIEVAGCPFCGDTPTVVECDIFDGHFYALRCENEKCSMNCESKLFLCQPLLEAESIWNKRERKYGEINIQK